MLENAGPMFDIIAASTAQQAHGGVAWKGDPRSRFLVGKGLELDNLGAHLFRLLASQVFCKGTVS